MSGSGLHLSHKVCWRDLGELFTSYKCPGIELPVGECGRIHSESRQVQHQLKNRTYLSDQVCQDSNCTSTGTKIFRKDYKSIIILEKPVYRENKFGELKSYTHFINSFADALIEFAKTERKKLKSRKILETNLEQEFIKMKEENKLNHWFHCRCELFVMLIEKGDIETLLSFSNDQIKSILSCQHGGQAVGNNINFLTFRVFWVYVYTNLIYAFDLQDKPQDWGPMKPGAYFRRDLDEDCDGQTFLNQSRQFLTDDSYMKDWNATKQLCKNCFQYLYILEMIRQEVDHNRTRDDVITCLLDVI